MRLLRPALALLLGLPTVASAQAPERPGRFQVGPFWITPKLELKNAGVDTNVFNSGSDPIPDTSIVFGPSLTALTTLGERLRLTGDGYVYLNYFGNNREEQSVDYGGSGRADFKVNRVTLFGGGGGTRGRQRYSLDVDERLLRLERYVTGGVKADFTRRTSLTGSGTWRIYEFEPSVVNGRNINESLDRQSRTATAELRYALTSETTLVFSGDGIEDDFDYVPPGGTRTARSYRAMGGFEFGRRAFLQGHVKAGIREFPGGSTRVPPYRGPAVSVQAILPFLLESRLSLQAERDVYYSAKQGSYRSDRLNNSFASSRYQAEVSFQVPFDLIAKGFGGFQEARYLLPEPLGTGRARRVDHLYTAGGSLLRQFTDSLRLGGTLYYEKRVSNFPGNSYQGLRYGISGELVP